MTGFAARANYVKPAKKNEEEDRAVTVAEMRQLLDQQSQAYQKSITELAAKISNLEEK